jgi:hypothetical protein
MTTISEDVLKEAFEQAWRQLSDELLVIKRQIDELGAIKLLDGLVHLNGESYGVDAVDGGTIESITNKAVDLQCAADALFSYSSMLLLLNELKYSADNPIEPYVPEDGEWDDSLEEVNSAPAIEKPQEASKTKPRKKTSLTKYDWSALTKVQQVEWSEHNINCPKCMAQPRRACSKNLTRERYLRGHGEGRSLGEGKVHASRLAKAKKMYATIEVEQLSAKGEEDRG